MFITEIAKISAREIYDSRGNPTIETTVQLRCGARGVASVPSGASTGAHEAWELRDGGDRLMGRGVLQAVSHVEGEIAQTLIGKSPLNQRRLDETLCQMDGTENLSRLGANAILSVSMACARAAAAALHLPLYRYLGGLPAGKLPGVMMNVLNGGVHAANNVDIQEFMLTPVSAGSVQQAVRMGAEVYHALKFLLQEKGLSASVGDEGGFAPDIPGDEDALVLLEEAVRRAGMIPGQDVCFSLDAAASGWQDGVGGYQLPKRGRRMSREEIIEFFTELAGRHPLFSLEDPLGEEDFQGFAQLKRALPGCLIVGDDLFVTNQARVQTGVAAGSAGALLVKPNQAGTLTRAMDAAREARQAGMALIVSHRSGETDSDFIADMAVAMGADFLKAGAPARGERVAKYNRLMAIEAELHS